MRSVVRGAWWLGVAALCAAPSTEAQTSLSIYADGRVVVRRTVAQRLDRGRSELTLPLEGLDPATLFSPDTAVAVVAVTLREPTDRSGALAAAVGRALSFVRAKGDTVRATVVRVDPPQYRLADGRLVLELPGEPLFPAELVRSAPEAAVTIDAARARPHTELAYVTHGAGWEALYQVLLGARGAAITGTAAVRSDALRATDADVQLVAGSIRQVRPPPSPMMRRQVMGLALAEEAADVGEAAVGETHVYALPGRLTLEPGVTTAVALFPRGAAPYVREFVVPGALPWRGMYGGAPVEPQRVPVQVWYTLRRERRTPFGDRPLPAGTVQLYQPDSSGRVQLVGEATLGHTPAGADVRLQSGDAFDVAAERVQTDYRVEDLTPARRGVPARRRVTAALRVTVTNAKTEAVTVDVRERRAGEWRVVESSVPSEKLSAAEARFRVTVPGGGEAVLTYTVQVDS